MNKLKIASEGINDIEMREEMIGRIEVLDKVGKLVTVNGIEEATTKMVALFYGVSSRRLEQLTSEIDFGREIIQDGAKLNIEGQSLKEYKTTYTDKTGESLGRINSLSLFNKRSILRIGMVLTKSEVAKELRTQLLNAIEDGADKIIESNISEEQRLSMEYGMAVMTGDLGKVSIATANLMAFKNRHIEKQAGTISIQEPKVQKFEALMNSKGNLDFNQFSKSADLVIGRNKFIDYLRNEKIIRPKPSTEPYQSFVDRGYFKVIQTVKSGFSVSRTTITKKGVNWLLDKCEIWELVKEGK